VEPATARWRRGAGGYQAIRVELSRPYGGRSGRKLRNECGAAKAGCGQDWEDFRDFGAIVPSHTEWAKEPLDCQPCAGAYELFQQEARGTPMHCTSAAVAPTVVLI